MTIKQVAVPDTNAGVELFLFDCAGQTVSLDSRHAPPLPRVASSHHPTTSGLQPGGVERDAL